MTNIFSRLSPKHGLSVSLIIVLSSLLACGQQASSEAIDFDREDVNGKTIKLSDYRGQWVIINFWASWCGPCIKEIPELLNYQADHPEVVILGVNFEELDHSALVKAIEEFNISYPVIAVREAHPPLVPFEPIKGLPSTFFVTPKGEYIASHVGPVTAEMITEFIGQENAQLAKAN